MASFKYILALDQGTTSSRAILFDKAGKIKTIAQKDFKQIYPKTGWVEHDPSEIWQTQYTVAKQVLDKINVENVASIGITNQRETTVVWDKQTGVPVYNAIVWQDRRTANYTDQLKKDGKESIVKDKTGLLLDPYFSATKIEWILDNIDGCREKAEQGKLAFGTIDTWLIWNLTKGKHHITDVTNASRTLLYNIHDMDWDNDLLEMFSIPKEVLPKVRPSSFIYGKTDSSLFKERITISGIAGDQQAALFGQNCIEPGMVKNTYGTGCFMLMNTGDQPISSDHNLLTTIAWMLDDKVEYALEGSVFMGGAIVQWLRDELGIINSSEEIEKIATSVENSSGVYLVPSFTGMGAPHWDPHAKGLITGLTRGSTSAHIARAALESIAYQCYDLLHAMEADSAIKLKELRVDGGASVNNFLMQFQANMLDIPVVRPRITETTALGAAFLAGLAVSYWEDQNDLAKQWESETIFNSKINKDEMVQNYSGWVKAVKMARSDL